MRRMRRIYTVSVQYLSYTQTDKVLALTEEALILIGFGGMCLMQLEMCMCKRKALVLCRRHFRFPHDEAQRTYAVSTYWRHDKDLKGCLPFLSIFLPFFLSSSVINDFFPTVKLFALLSDTTNRHPSDLLFHAIVALFPLARLFAPRPCCKRYAIVSSGILCDLDTRRRKEIYMCKDLFHTGQSDRAIALWLGRRRTKAGSTVNCPSCWKHRAFRGQEILGRHSSRWHPPYFPWLFHLGYASRLQEQRGNGRNPFPCSHCYTWKPSRQRSKKPACTIWLPLLLTVSSRKVARRKRSMTYWSLRMAWTSGNQNLVLLSLWSRTILTATITRRQSSTASEPSKPMLVTKSRRRGKSASDIR